MRIVEWLRRAMGTSQLMSDLERLSQELIPLRVEVASLRKLIEVEFLACEDRDRDSRILSGESPALAAPKVTLETSHPLAINSDDHNFPRGTRNDNTRHPRFVRACEVLLDKPIWHLDLGCAGGGLVWDFVIAGHNSFGIEGSDFSLKERRAEWRSIPQRLFTADVTQPFRMIGGDGDICKFDVITAWEVLEHIQEDMLPGFFDNVTRHLRPGGLFVASIAMFEDKDPATGAVWHVTVKPRDWWAARLATFGFTPEEGLFAHADFVRGSGNIRSLGDWDARTDPSLGFHVVYRK